MLCAALATASCIALLIHTFAAILVRSGSGDISLQSKNTCVPSHASTQYHCILELPVLTSPSSDPQIQHILVISTYLSEHLPQFESIA